MKPAGSRGPMLLAFLAVVVLGIHKFRSVEFLRPLGEDELITLRVYTGAGVRADGTPRDLRRREQLQALPALSPAELGMGLYASLGRWAEPNNHILHSALVNPFLGRVKPIEAAARLPALLAAGGFALALAWLCVLSQRPWGAPIAAALAMVCPYVSWYSAESRGYALMMLLLVLVVLALRRLLARPESVFGGGALAAVSVLSVVNLVNLSADWIAPAFAIAFLVPDWIQSQSADRSAVRRSLIACGCAIAGIVGVFAADRLPYLVSAMQQYGLPYSGVAGYGEQARALLEYLFPTLVWKIWGMIGLIGAVVAALSRETRGVIVLGFAALMASALHFAVAGKFPYLRNGGYLLIPLQFGSAVLLDRTIQRMNRAPLKWGFAVFLTAGIASIEWVDPPADPDPNYAAFCGTLAATPVDGTPGRVILERRVPKSLDLDFPEGWENAEVEFPASGKVDLIRVEKIGADYAFRSERYRIATAGPADWVVWQPPFAVTAVNPEPLLEELKHDGATTIRPFHARYAAKIYVLSRVTVIMAEGKDQPVLGRAAEKYGGTLKVLRRD